MTAKEGSVEEKLGEFTECCICTEVYDDPRVLPCIHTFCLKCIQLTGNEKKPGEEMACPICRTEFIVPTTGFVGLKKHFFVAKLVEMVTLHKPAIRETLCDVCRENTDEEPISEVAIATMYCTQCRDHLCDRCFRDHRRHKLSRDHQVVALESGTVQEEDIRRFRPSKCEQHVKEQLKLYCLPCKSVLCMMCYIEGHGTHQCSDVEKVAEDFRKDIEKNLGEIEMFLNECLTEKQEFEKYRTEVAKEIEETQSVVILRSRNLKELIDKHTAHLLEELALMKQSKLKDIELKNEELERRRTILDSFKMYCMEMKSKGSSSDICRVIKELQDRTGVLRQMVTTKKDTRSQQKQLHIFFEPTNLEGFSKAYNLVGALKEEASQEVDPILFKTVITGITDGSTIVRGFAILDKHIFIVSAESLEIEVYDSTSFIFQCQRKLKELTDPIDIASCNRNKCLYILNRKDDTGPMEIMRVDSMGKLVNKWSLGENWGLYLFITADSSILLPVPTKKRLNEYSPDGQLIRKIKLSPELNYPIHALKLADDKFAVSFANLYSASDNDDHSSITSEDESNSEEENESSDNERKNLEEEKEEGKGEQIEKDGTEEEEEKDEEEEKEEKDEEVDEDGDETEDENENKTTSSEEEDNDSKISTSSEEEDKGKIGSDTDDETEEKSNDNEDSEQESDEKVNDHRVCIVDGNGDVLKSFGHGIGSGLGQLNCPTCLTIDREGQIIVADLGNSRVLLLSPDLEFRRELISKKQGFRHPQKVQLDEATSRLFVMTNAPKGNKRIGGSALFFQLK